MWFTFGHCGHESPGDGRQGWTVFRSIWNYATYKIVFLISHDPRTGRDSVIPGTRISIVGGFHGAIVVVAAVDFCVAVVKAAAGIEVVAVNDPVLPFCLIVNCCALRVVLTEPHAWRDENAIDFMAHNRDRRHVSDWKIVESAHGRTAESAKWRLRQIVVLGRLIVDRG